MADRGWVKKVLVEDERGRACPAVVQYGPYLFVSGSDGYRDLTTEKIDPELADNATAQCQNSYGRIARRLEKAGYSGDCCVWIENFTSGQHWRLERMALWPEYFGEIGHGQAVSFGAQTKLAGINMLTACALALTPDIPREVAVKPPGRGRASRITRAGDLLFVIGVRGHENPKTKAVAPEEIEGAFDVQLDNCFDWIESHLSHAGAPMENLLRLDCCLREPKKVDRYFDMLRERMGGKIPVAGYAMATILGGRTEQEVGGIAAAPGIARDVSWSQSLAGLAEATRAGGLVFSTACSGLLDGAGGAIKADLYGNLEGQVGQALANVEAVIKRLDSGLDRLLRLDMFVRDIYREDEIVSYLANRLGKDTPVLNIIGAEPNHGAEVEVVAIAAQ